MTGNAPSYVIRRANTIGRLVPLPAGWGLIAVYSHGAPTWWLPQAYRIRGGLYVGWLRWAFALALTGPDQEASRDR